jgi:hypothetical protein
MSDEPSKKAGKQPESATLDRLKAELSAGLKPGEDPLYYDWTRVAEAPPSEAAYVPPMQIHTQAMDTRDLAAIIGRDAAEAARHAPAPEHKVLIEEPGARTDEAIEVDFGDAIPTQEMHAPISDDRYAVTRRLVAVGQRGRSGWIWVACAIAAVLGCAAFVWNQRGSDPVTPAASVPPSGLGAAKQVKGPHAAETPVSALAASTAPTAAPIPELPAEPVAQKPPAGISPQTGSSLAVQRPEQQPSHRPSGASRNRPSSPQTVQPKATANENADPIFTDKPNF